MEQAKAAHENASQAAESDALKEVGKVRTASITGAVPALLAMVYRHIY
jgi:hypothetical protein